MKPNDLCFPVKILDQHLVMLGKTGAGKSSALRHIVEYLLGKNKRVCIVDPKGDWYGLKVSADGKSPGYPVILFGDFKDPNASDVPINQHSGRHVAELITSGNRPCVIGFRGWMTSHMVQFWIDFAAGIFNANSGELFLVGDEFHNFAPKGKIMDPQAGKCLHWSNRLLSEGRGLGIVCLLASQRPQKVHNDTLTSCETLIAMRVVHAADRGAVEDWIKGCGDKERGKDVLNSLASMARGEAFVWSPEIDFGPTRVKFPMFHTFDSFAPPQLQKKVDVRGWADVDIDAVKEKLAAVIEKAKSEDPKELRKQIVELRAQLAAKLVPVQPPPKTEIKRVEIPALKHGEIKQLRQFIGLIESCIKTAEGVKYTMESAIDNAKTISQEINKALEVEHFEAGSVVITDCTRIGNAPVEISPGKLIGRQANMTAVEITTNLERAQAYILIALAQYGTARDGKQLALLSGYRYNRHMRNNLSALRAAGYITGDNLTPIDITDAGRKVLGDFPRRLETPAALAVHWRAQFDKQPAAILSVLLQYPHGTDHKNLSERTGYTYNRHFRNSLSELRSAGVLIGPNMGTMKPAPELV